MIELASATVLVWRLTVELRHGQAFAENAERMASRIGGALLFALAAYVVASAGWKLWMQHGAEFSLPGLIISVLAIPTMYFLARQKLRLADALGSHSPGVEPRVAPGLGHGVDGHLRAEGCASEQPRFAG